MKTESPPIPLESVVVFPRRVLVGSACLGACGLLVAVATAVAVLTGQMALPGGRRLAGLLVGLLSSLLLLAVPWLLGRARIRATDLFRNVRRPPPRGATLAAAAGLTACVLAAAAVGWGLGWQPRQLATLAVLGLTAGGTLGLSGVFRRHLHRQAVAVFAVYAEGALLPADAAAIDAARRADPAFDAAVKEHLAITARVAEHLRALQ